MAVQTCRFDATYKSRLREIRKKKKSGERMEGGDGKEKGGGRGEKESVKGVIGRGKSGVESIVGSLL